MTEKRIRYFVTRDPYPEWGEVTESEFAALGWGLRVPHEQTRLRNGVRGKVIEEVILDMDEICRLVRAWGRFAYVEQTGGGVACIYAGEETGAGWQVSAGPGWFEGTRARALAIDFTIGPGDEQTERHRPTDYTPTGPGWTEGDVAREIMRRLELER